MMQKRSPRKRVVTAGKDPQRALIEGVAMDIGKEIVAYIEALYPGAIEHTSSTFKLSVRNSIFNHIMCAMNLDMSDEAAVLKWLAERKKHRRDLLRLAKTGRAAVATLSRACARILDAYIASLAVEVAPNAPIFRNRSGRAYSKDTLGDDFRDVRTTVFGEAETRTIADLRRSGAIEALRGGASLSLVGQKLANDVGSNPSLARTYVPVDLDAVRAVDRARKDARK